MPISPQQLLAGRTVAAENDLMKVASACENYGVELALLKLAEMEESAKEEADEKEKEEKGEHPALSEDEKKEAAAMGLYALEGFINKLASAGQTFYGDPSVYIRELAIDSGAYTKVAAAEKALGPINLGAAKMWNRLTAGSGKAGVPGMAASATRGTAQSTKTRSGLTGAGVGAALGGVGGALGSDDSLAGGAIGGIAGGLTGAGAGLGLRGGARYLAHHGGRERAMMARSLKNRATPEELRQMQLARVDEI